MARKQVVFSEAESSRKTIGDVDVVYADGLYHLFHLVLPNHDFIAHAVSTDGVNWRRVNNALFIGHPGSWDDLMLWTIHVSRDPHTAGRWRMFYTGLSRREQGKYQRLGLAVSDDLFHWTKAPVHWLDKRGASDPEPVRRAVQWSRPARADAHHAAYDPESSFPLEPESTHYESRLDEGRSWVSFRDPFFFCEEGRGWLLATGRVNHGPVVRRGCVSLLEEVGPGRFESRPPLHHPRLYDDIEVPNLVKLGEDYYLVGSIREDAKIRYWHSTCLGGPWQSHHDNVLLAQGNYAGRISRDPKGWLLWNFFSLHRDSRTTYNILPPPKRLSRAEDGLLKLTTFEQFDEWTESRVDHSKIKALSSCGEDDVCRALDGTIELKSDAGFQAFVFPESLVCFRLRANLALKGRGKCGLLIRLDEQSRDGYYLALDLAKGSAQLRAWQTGPHGAGEDMMQFRTLQGAQWAMEFPGHARVQLLAFGSYLELSIDDRIVLSLADPTFDSGLLGVYLESAHAFLRDVTLDRLRSTTQSVGHLAAG